MGALLQGWYWQARGAFLPAALAQANSSSPAGPSCEVPPLWALFAQASPALYSYLISAALLPTLESVVPLASVFLKRPLVPNFLGQKPFIFCTLPSFWFSWGWEEPQFPGVEFVYSSCNKVTTNLLA